MKEWEQEIQNKNALKEIHIKITNYAYDSPTAKAVKSGNTGNIDESIIADYILKCSMVL